VKKQPVWGMLNNYRCTCM